MNIFPKLLKIFILMSVLVMVALGGCVSNSTVSGFSSALDIDLDESAPEALIATDLVTVLMQLNEFAPWATTLSVSQQSPSIFGTNIEHVLRLSGFGVQRVTADQGENFVSYSKSNIVSETNGPTKYEIAIGQVSISRHYEFSNGQVFPTAPIEIVGVEPTKIVINNDLYRQLGGDRIIPNGVIFKTSSGRTLGAKKYNLAVTNSAKKSAEELFSHQRFLVLAKSRLFLDSKLSTNIDVRNWTPVRQLLLVFPSKDNLYIGSRNKIAIKKLLEFYDPKSTGFSITGCKGNSSLLWDGTEGDSLERQLRIRNELLVAGVDIDRIRENGCFAGEFDSQLSKKSVLLILHERQ